MDAALTAEPPRTPDLVAQLGSEVAVSLSAALERVDAFAATGRIDSTSLRALRAEIDGARRAGMMGQQVGRVASGAVELRPETVDLAALVRDAVDARADDAAARGIELREQLQPADVQLDAALTHSLLQALLSWSLEHARTRVDLALERPATPGGVRLVCSFGTGGAPADRLDTIAWRLVEQTAGALGLRTARADRAGRTALTVEFADPGQGRDAARPLVGSQILIVAADAGLRERLRTALRPEGVLLDAVATVADARAYCAAGIPHALLHDAALAGAELNQLKRELRRQAPRLAWVRVGSADPLATLPAVLMAELARAG